MSKFIVDLLNNVKAGVPVLRVDTSEENRAVLEIQQVGWHLVQGKTLELEDAQRHVLAKAFAKLGNKADGLLDGNVLLVDGPRLHELLDHVAPAANTILTAAVEKKGYQVVSWDIVRGFNDVEPSDVDRSFRENLSGALMATITERFKGHMLFIFKDCHHFLGHSCDDPIPRRVLREIVELESLMVHREVNKTEIVDRRHLVLLQPHWRPHADITHYLIPVDFDLPDTASIDREIDFVRESMLGSRPNVEVPPPIRQQLRQVLRGLTRYEIDNIATMAAVASGGFNDETVKLVQRLKAKTFEREESLTWIDSDHIPAIEAFAGIDNYLEWIREAREAYSDEARAAGIKPEKGALLLGIPGTGKSMLGMATAKEMKLPLIKFDFSSVLGSFVGESEANMRRALHRIKGEGDCVLFVDEADKAFSNVLGPQAGSNVEQHIFGQFISWMANENDSAFVLLTMNRTGGVPIEMLRSGRIGMIWFTTFPTPEERLDILRLKLRENNCDPELFGDDQYTQLVQKTDQYVGAELEEIVLKATKIAWSKRRSVQPTFGELQTAALRIRPVASLDLKNIQDINEFCKSKAQPVSRSVEQSRRDGQRQQRSIDMGGNVGDN